MNLVLLVNHYGEVGLPNLYLQLQECLVHQVHSSFWHPTARYSIFGAER